MSGDRTPTFRRTKRTGVVVAAATLLTFLVTDPGSAAPGAPAQEVFNNGTGSAIALGYKVNPTNGNLSFGITAGESVTGHQNTGATGQSRAINLGVIGVTLAREACDDGDATLPEDKQPQPVVVRTGDEGADAGKTEDEGGLITKFARATTEPFAEAITEIAPAGHPDAVSISGGRITSHSGVVGGNVREALARTELGEVSLAGGAVKLQGLVWEALHRTGADEKVAGTFTIKGLEVGGQSVPLPADSGGQIAAVNTAIAPLGLRFVEPATRVEQGIVFVDPLKLAVVPSPERDSLTGPLVGGAQPARAAVTDALIAADCGNATYITVADVVLGSLTGAGQLGLELGGVQATTASSKAFQLGALPSLPPMLPSVGGAAGSTNLPTLTGGSAAAPAAAPDSPGPTSPAAADEVAAAPIADLSGERGGAMALIAGGGLAALLASAEADRRKMRHALREIPLEA